MYNNDDSSGETRQFGPYRLLRPIGHGGMATVYEGIDTRIDRHVAVKVQTPSSPTALGERTVEDDPGSRLARHQREARLLANLSHPNIVTIYDIGEYDGSPYMVMEYLNGVTLQEYLVRRGNEPLPLAEVAAILDQIASGLDALHNAGIVHRDLKAANVMLLETSSPPLVKLLDLGIARPTSDLMLTRTGVILGSPSYVSPEVIQGRTATEASDLWGLGVLLYAMLSGGTLPFTGDELPAVLYRIAHTPPAPLPNLPPALQGVLAKALSKDPAARPASASALAHAFRAALPGAVRALPLRAVRRRNTALAPALALAAFVLVCFFAGWSWQNQAPPAPSGPAALQRPLGAGGDAGLSATKSPPFMGAGGATYGQSSSNAAPMETPTVSPTATPKPASRSRLTVVENTPKPVPTPVAVSTRKSPPGPQGRYDAAAPLGAGGAKLVAKPTPAPLRGYIDPTPKPAPNVPTVAVVPDAPVRWRAAATPTPAPVPSPSPTTPERETPPSVVVSSAQDTPERPHERPEGNVAVDEPVVPNPDDNLPAYLTETGKDGVRAALDAWLDAAMFGDLDTLMAFYAPRLERYGPAGTDLPRAAVRADKERSRADVRPLGISIDDPKIELNDDKTRATLRFRETVVWPREAGNRPSHSRREMTWVFTDEGWKIVGERTLR